MKAAFVLMAPANCSMQLGSLNVLYLSDLVSLLTFLLQSSFCRDSSSDADSVICGNVPQVRALNSLLRNYALLMHYRIFSLETPSRFLFLCTTTEQNVLASAEWCNYIFTPDAPQNRFRRISGKLFFSI